MQKCLGAEPTRKGHALPNGFKNRSNVEKSVPLALEMGSKMREKYTRKRSIANADGNALLPPP